MRIVLRVQHRARNEFLCETQNIHKKMLEKFCDIIYTKNSSDSSADSPGFGWIDMPHICGDEPEMG